MLKKLFVLGAFLFSMGLAWADDSATSDALTIIAAAPPALVNVTDGQGRRTGPDFSKPLGNDGSQDPKVVLTEIPLSQAAQSRPAPVSTPGLSASPVASPNASPVSAASATPTPAASTVWTLSLVNGGAQTYSLIFKGTVLGVSDVFFSGLCKPGVPALERKFGLFVWPGVTRKVNVDFDPDAKSLSIKLDAKGRDLCDDVQRAAELHLITTAQAASHLSQQATVVLNLWNRHKLSDAYGALQDFLYSLGESRPRGCKDEDDSAQVQPEALSALITEAQSLLAQLPGPISIEIK